MYIYRKTQENTALSKVLSMLRSERDGKLCWQKCQPQQATHQQYGDSATEAKQMDSRTLPYEDRSSCSPMAIMLPKS